MQKEGRKKQARPYKQQRIHVHDCLGCAVLPCLVVCLTLLASFFLPSHLSLKHVCTSKCIHVVQVNVYMLYYLCLYLIEEVALAEGYRSEVNEVHE